MKRNWLLIKEILEFLTDQEDCKVQWIGDTHEIDDKRKTVLIKDEYFIEYEKLMYPETDEDVHIAFSMKQDELLLKAHCALYNTDSNIWDEKLVDYHINLLCEIKAIKIIEEDVAKDVNDEIIGESYGYYDDAEILTDRLGQAYQAIFRDQEFYQIIWLGIEMLAVLESMMEDGVDLKTLDKPHPTILKYINPLINKTNNLKLATLPLK